jgi:SAM-dependent methyltransferase
MDKDIFHQMAQIEEHHWWFSGRRKIVESVIAGLHLSHDADILEAGCGTGGNLAMLSRYGRVFGTELDDLARQYAIDRKIGTIEPGRLPDQIPFAPQQFDLIVLTDVLEHLDDDSGSLKALHVRLKPGGRLLITVPAFPFLWSRHDDTHHHKRRYLKQNLIDVVKGAGFAINFVSYYNALLFPMVAGVRYIKKSMKNDTDDLGTPPELVNSLLRGLFSSERHVLGYLSLPFGVSLFMLAQRSDINSKLETQH